MAGGHGSRTEKWREEGKKRRRKGRIARGKKEERGEREGRRRRKRRKIKLSESE